MALKQRLKFMKPRFRILPNNFIFRRMLIRGAFRKLCNPAGKYCQNDVVSTSMRRNDVVSTFIRRHF